MQGGSSGSDEPPSRISYTTDFLKKNYKLAYKTDVGARKVERDYT